MLLTSSLCNLSVLCDSIEMISTTHHRDTENTEAAQEIKLEITNCCGRYMQKSADARMIEMDERTNLTGLSQAELVGFVEQIGEPAYRGRQIFAALQHRRLQSFDEMSDLPKALRERLHETATASTLTVESRYLSEDGTRRFLMKTHDNLPVETVFIPEERRDTICFSSQSGCPLQCTFCLTAQLGLLRSLTPGEIVEQIIIALNDAYGVGEKPPRGTNLVGMGAGEPFLNFDSLMKALRIMADPQGLVYRAASRDGFNCRSGAAHSRAGNNSGSSQPGDITSSADGRNARRANADQQEMAAGRIAWSLQGV